MKRFIISMAILPLLFIGCSKSSPDTPQPEEKKYEVNFKANLMDISVSPIGKKIATTQASAINAADLLKEEIAYVEFLVYDRNENLVAFQTSSLFDAQNNFDATGLEFKSELPKGDYSIAVIARSRKATFYKNDKQKDQHFLVFNSLLVNEIELIEFSPVFIHKYSSFKVEDKAINNQIQLTRLNAQLELNIQDEIPSNVRYLHFGGSSHIYAYPWSKTYINSPVGKSFIGFDLDGIRNQTSKVLKTPFFPDYFSTKDIQKLKSYDVLLFDKDYKYLGTKTIDNIYFMENSITRLTGKFFDTLSPESKTTSIKVDFVQEYNSSVIETNF